MDAHGHIGHDADLHASFLGCFLGAAELLGGDPFHPTVEVERIRELVAQIRDLRGILGQRALPVVRVRARRAPLVIAQAPCGVGLQLLAAGLLERLELGLSGFVAPDLEQNPQGVHLGAPHRVPVDDLRVAVQRGHAVVQIVDLGLNRFVRGAVLLDGLGPDVGEVHEPAGHRQIRRRGQRGDRFGRVHRVDQHEIGTGAPLGVHQQRLQILEVAHAPRVRGTNRIQLGHPAPQLAALQRFRQLHAAGGADQRGVLGAAVHRHMQRVVADRHIVGDLHQRGGDEPAVDDMRLLAAVAHHGQRAFVRLAVLHRDAGRRHGHDTRIDPDVIGCAGGVQHRGRHQAAVPLMHNGVDGPLDGLITGGVHPQCRQHVDQHIVFDLVIIVALTDIACSDSQHLCQSNQRSGQTFLLFSLVSHSPSVKRRKPRHAADMPRMPTFSAL